MQQEQILNGLSMAVVLGPKIFTLPIKFLAYCDEL